MTSTQDDKLADEIQIVKAKSQSLNAEFKRIVDLIEAAK